MTEILVTIQGIAVSTAFLTIILAILLKPLTKNKNYKSVSESNPSTK